MSSASTSSTNSSTSTGFNWRKLVWVVVVMIALLICNSIWHWGSKIAPSPEEKIANQTTELRQAVAQNFLNTTAKDVSGAVRKPDKAIVDFNVKREANKVRQELLDHPERRGCSVGSTPDPVTHNIHVFVPKCNETSGKALVIHGKEGEVYFYHVSKWSIHQYDQVGNELPGRIPAAGAPTFDRGYMAIAACTADGNGELNCKFAGNVLLEVPYLGADLDMKYIKTEEDKR